jgi:hypothetical protein
MSATIAFTAMGSSEVVTSDAWSAALGSPAQRASADGNDRAEAAVADITPLVLPDAQPGGRPAGSRLSVAAAGVGVVGYGTRMRCGWKLGKM